MNAIDSAARSVETDPAPLPTAPANQLDVRPADTTSADATDFRVCVVCGSLPPDYGGAEIAAFRYAERLAERDADPILLAPRDGDRPAGSDLPTFVRPIPATWSSAGGGRLGAVCHLAGIARELWPELVRLRHRYDLVHVFNSSPVFNLMAVPVARWLGKPVILEMSLVGSDDPLTLAGRARQGSTNRSRRPLRYRLYRRADAYVSKSRPLTEAYERSGLPRSRLWEIPYAVDTRRYRPAEATEKRELRSALGLPRDATIILFVGGLNPRKGVHVLLRAFHRVHSRADRVHLVLAGPDDKYDPAYVRDLRDFTTGAGLSEAVTFETRLVPNVDEYMRAADLFTLPSSREGLPISVLEAMATGLPVVASDIPEISTSQVTDGVEGRLVPPGDEDRLAAALSSLIEDVDARVTLGEAARRRAEQLFSTEAVDRRYGDMYARLSKTTRTGGRR